MRRVYVLLTSLLAACSTVSTPSSSTITPATFVMTWPATAFAQTAVGSTAASPIAVTLSNYGTSGVPVTSFSSSNPSEFPATTTCAVGGSLAPKSTCQITTNFKPSTTGARTSTLTIAANGSSSTIDLTGTGVTAVTPHVAIDIAAGPPGTIFTLAVTAATPSSTVTLNTIYRATPASPGVVTTTAGWATDGSGNATIASNSDDRGTYESWVVDATTGVASNHVTHAVQ